MGRSVGDEGVARAVEALADDPLVASRLTADPGLLARLRAFVADTLARLGFKGTIGRHRIAVRDAVLRALDEAARDRGGETDSPRFSIAPPVESEAFKRWFKDSKVVDKDGKPLVVYHGTHTENLTVFDRLAKAKERRAPKVDTIGSWFTTEEKSGGAYGPITVSAYLNIKNPRRYEGTGNRDTRQVAAKQLWADIHKHESAEQFREAMKERGFDGILIANDHLDGLPGDVWVAFDPAQIKSATGNRGTFDPGNPDIRFSVERAGDGKRSGPFGPIYTRFKGRFRNALNFLRRERDGEAVGVLDHPDVPGPISLVWGKVGTAANRYEDGYGIAKMDVKHPGVVDVLPSILPSLRGVRSSADPSKIVLRGDGNTVVVQHGWNGRGNYWLVTAYNKMGEGPALGQTAGVPETPVAGRGETSSPAEPSPDDTPDDGLRFSVAPRSDDAAYFAALERGDTEAAQKIVDAEAARAGYWRRDDYGSKWGFAKVGITPREIQSQGISLTRKDLANLERLNVPGPVMFDGVTDSVVWSRDGITAYDSKKSGLTWRRYVYDDGGAQAKGVLLVAFPSDPDRRSHGFPKITAKYVPQEFRRQGIGTKLTEAALADLGEINADYMLSPDAVATYRRYLERGYIKLADLVTRDDAGNIIPPSRRFDRSNPDIRFSVEPVALSGEEIPRSDNIAVYRRAAIEFARRTFPKSVVNERDGSTILIPIRGGVQRSLEHGSGPDKIAAVAAIPDLLRVAVRTGTEPDRKGRPEIRSVHTYAAPLRIAERHYRADLIVRETNTGARFYDHELSRITEEPAGNPGESPVSGSSSAQPAAGSSRDDTPESGPRFSIAPPVESEAFKRWFGDSKVVDKDGKPLVVYHGTQNVFTAFNTVADGDLGSHFGTRDQAAEFAGGSAYGRMMPVYLSIQNPVRLIDTGEWSDAEVLPQLERLGLIDSVEEAGERSAREILQQAGYDGVVYMNRREGFGKPLIQRIGQDAHDRELRRPLSDTAFRRLVPEATDSYIAFDPAQIKSATGNRGTFDPENPDIRFSVEPVVKITRDDFGEGLTDAQVRDAATTELERLRRERPDGIRNTDTGRMVRFSARGNRKAWSNLADIRRALLVKHLPVLIERAALVSSRPPVPAEAGTRAYHRFQTAAAFDGVTLPVKLLVREDVNGDWFYNADVGSVNVEDPPASPRQAPVEGRRTSANGGSSTPDVTPEGGPRFSIAPPVESEAFKRWFGDSKVVEKDGKPLVVYHGTHSDFSTFATGGRPSHGYPAADGYFFSDSTRASVAWNSRHEEDGRVLPVYLRISNPLYIDKEGWGTPSIEAEWIMEARRGGHDGIIGKDPSRRDGTVWDETFYIAFRPAQIKSATGNRGTFDPADPDIRFSVKPVEITGEEITADPRGPSKQQARAFLRDNFQGRRFVNDETGERWAFTSRSANHILTWAHGVDERRLFAAIPEIVKRARLQGSIRVQDAEQPNLKSFRRFAAEATVAGRPYTVEVQVKTFDQSRQPIEGLTEFHLIFNQKAKKAPPGNEVARDEPGLASPDGEASGESTQEPDPRFALRPSTRYTPGLVGPETRTAAQRPEQRAAAVKANLHRLRRLRREGTAAAKMLSWRGAIDELAGALNMRPPLRNKRGMRRTALGYYTPWLQTIRLGRPDNLRTFVHEVGHYLNDLLFPAMKVHGRSALLVFPKSWRPEMVALGKALYGTRKPAGGYGKPSKPGDRAAGAGGLHRGGVLLGGTAIRLFTEPSRSTRCHPKLGAPAWENPNLRSRGHTSPRACRWKNGRRCCGASTGARNSSA
ncbi:MAG: hypothetical protein JNK25_10545 [Phycisphaerae bacterium]|nr:hypothetical protein [Phycisphaerae bacterium]